MTENEPSDSENDAYATTWDPDREDLRWVPPGAALPALINLPTHTEAVQEANRLLMNTGFAINIRTPLYTKPSRANPVRTVCGAVLRCAQGRTYSSTGSNKRKQSSRMTACEWKGRMRWVEAEGASGASGWQFTTEDGRHNHPAAGVLALPQFRKRDEALLERIKGAKSNRDSAMKILRKERSAGANIIRSDVSNELAKLRCEELGGRTRIQALAEFLSTYSCDDSGNEDTKFWHKITQDDQGRAQVVQYLKELFDYLSVSPKCFLTDHDRSLKAGLSVIFPGIPQRRCIWHIYQNVQTEAVKAWDVRRVATAEEKDVIEKARLDFIQVWQSLVSCPTEDAFWALKEQIWESYAGFPALLQYLKAHQLPHYHEWAECICKFFPDFGQKATSRVEGAHRQLKLALTSWKAGHIYDVVLDIHQLVLVQRNEHDGHLQLDEARHATDCLLLEFARLHRKVSHQGLRKLKEQLLLAKDERYDELEECSGAFSMKFGLPCKHTLHRQLNEPGGLVIDPKDIHQHWWYHPPRARGEEVQDERYILDPEKIRPKGRPQGSTTVTLPSTQVSQSLRGRQPQRQPREKTRNEHVQATQQTQQAEEASDDDIEPRRGNRRRQPTQKVLENMQDPVEISSAEESSSDDEVIVQEVLVTRTAKRVVRKVTKKPTANDRILGVLEKVLANQAELSKRLQAVEKPQQVHDDFINVGHRAYPLAPLWATRQPPIYPLVPLRPSSFSPPTAIDIDHDSPPKQPRKKRKAP
ncbi:MULE transposase domain-containing protein [Pyrenophora tritici-repentis]|nr:MULE transposase domain-containing protein [Pyrenophora tritici-repentis]